jgi:hypothetical protein
MQKRAEAPARRWQGRLTALALRRHLHSGA